MNPSDHVELVPADSTESLPEGPNFEYAVLVGGLMGADGERKVGIQTYTALYPVDFDAEHARFVLDDLQRAIHWVETGEYDGVDPAVMAAREAYTVKKATAANAAAFKADLHA